MKDSMLTVACVFKASVFEGKTGDCYNAMWVQKLKRNVAEYLSVPHRFVCLTNTDVPEVECLPLKYPAWNGWWSKIELFEPGRFTGPVLFLDLDIFATSSLDDFVKPHPNLIMLRDHLPHIKNSSVMYWNGSDERMHAIFNAFKADPEGAKKRHLETNSLGDQGFIRSIMDKQQAPIDLWQELLGDQGFVPFSMGGRINPILISGDLPYNTRLVYCLGYPKFHQCQQLKLVQDYWMGKENYPVYSTR